MKRELGGTKKMLKAVTFQVTFAWILATIVYQVGSRIENGTFNLPNMLVVAIIIAIVILIFTQKKNKGGECNKCPYCKDCGKSEKLQIK